MLPGWLTTRRWRGLRRPDLKPKAIPPMPRTYFRHTELGIFYAYNPTTWAKDPACTRLSLVAGKAAHRAQCIERLRPLLPIGGTVYVVLRNRSRLGTCRTLDLYAIEDGRPRKISRLVAGACGLRCDEKTDQLRVYDLGFDAADEVACLLGSALWPGGTPEPHSFRDGLPDSAGWTALRAEWL
jgi:hypothetical protein